jgi:DNA-binding transcriptional LysR family regulator
MADTLSLFRAFIRVVEAGSFSRVAHERYSSQPTVRHHVAALEAHLSNDGAVHSIVAT